MIYSPSFFTYKRASLIEPLCTSIQILKAYDSLTKIILANFTSEHFFRIVRVGLGVSCLGVNPWANF